MKPHELLQIRPVKAGDPFPGEIPPNIRQIPAVPIFPLSNERDDVGLTFGYVYMFRLPTAKYILTDNNGITYSLCKVGEAKNPFERMKTVRSSVEKSNKDEQTRSLLPQPAIERLLLGDLQEALDFGFVIPTYYRWSIETLVRTSLGIKFDESQWTQLFQKPANEILLTGKTEFVVVRTDIFEQLRETFLQIAEINLTTINTILVSKQNKTQQEERFRELFLNPLCQRFPNVDPEPIPDPPNHFFIRGTQIACQVVPPIVIPFPIITPQ